MTEEAGRMWIHLLIKICEEPPLFRRTQVVVSSSKYFVTRFGCLQASHDFLHNDAATYFGQCQRKSWGLTSGSGSASKVSRLPYLFTKTLKNLFPTASRTFTILNHLQYLYFKPHEICTESGSFRPSENNWISPGGNPSLIFLRFPPVCLKPFSYPQNSVE